MVLKHVLRKKKSNCFAYFFTTLTSVSTSTEFSEEDLVTEDTFPFFSLNGEGHSFSSLFISFNSCLISLFLRIGMSSLEIGMSCLVSTSGLLNRLSIRAILSSFCYFLKAIGNLHLNVDFRSHLSAVISGSKNFMVQIPLSSFLVPSPDSGAHSSGF